MPSFYHNNSDMMEEEEKKHLGWYAENTRYNCDYCTDTFNQYSTVQYSTDIQEVNYSAKQLVAARLVSHSMVL